MSSVSAAVVNNASSAGTGTVQSVAAISVMKKAMDAQESTANQLIQSLPQPALASSGSVGTKVNTYA